MPPTREPWADSLKGTLIILVVFWHVVMHSFLRIDWRLAAPLPGAWGAAADLIWPWLMPTFMLISGYLAAAALKRPWPQVWRPKVARFAYLFVLWTLIHAATMWAIPDFPTFIPRAFSQAIAGLTIGPPNTWYLQALALYFVIAKLLSRRSLPMQLTLAAALSMAVAANWIPAAHNRGSLLGNFVFFLAGVHLAPQIHRLVTRATGKVAAMAWLGYLSAWTLMRGARSHDLPGVWLAVSTLGVLAMLCAAGVFSRSSRPRAGAGGLAWIGARTLGIYVIHMPLLALADWALAVPISAAGPRAQLVVAALLPLALTGVIVAASIGASALINRLGWYWLFDLPGVQVTRRQAPR
ncbi:MAG: acyltransferase [Promicromonosporaceae bacterium]|nr:acyltransferase [Promicromonosporaceae bacterium]